MKSSLLFSRTLSASALIGLVLFSAYSVSRQIPEQSLLPCDEVEQEALQEASPEEIKRLGSYTPALPLKRVNPTYPRSAARSGNEGWVLMNFVVDEEGTVQDPVIEDFEGDKSFKRSALNAVKNWSYSPAIKDGKPTQQCHNAVRLDFTLAQQNGASRTFVKDYRAAIELLGEGDVEGAGDILDKLKNGDSSNRYENAWMSSLETQIAELLEDDARELRAIKRTIGSSSTHSKTKRTFDDNYMAYLYQRSFILETALGRYADALETAEKIASLDDGKALIQPLKKTIEEVEGLILSEQHLSISVDLPESGSFFHSLARNQFAFTDIQGRLETVEVRCETHREKFTIAEDFVWSIPESWGACRVLVKGDQGAKFGLVEVNQI